MLPTRYFASQRTRRPRRALSAGLALKVADAARSRFRRQRDYRRLLELPDYLLDDVGLTRAEISAARRLF